MLNKATNATRRNLVFRLMSDGKWHKTMDICGAVVGGSEGTRRLRELRKECEEGLRSGWSTIEKRRVSGSTQYEYRLVPGDGTIVEPPPPPEKTSSHRLF